MTVVTPPTERGGGLTPLQVTGDEAVPGEVTADVQSPS